MQVSRQLILSSKVFYSESSNHRRASPLTSLYKRSTLATQQDLVNTIGFFESAVRAATTSGDLSVSSVVDDGFQSVYDVVNGKTSIAGVSIANVSSVKNLVIPDIWGPLCKIIICDPIPKPHPICDITICNPIPDGDCLSGLCGPTGPRGPIFPPNPVVDPIDPDFALAQLQTLVDGSNPLKKVPLVSLEAEDIKQLVSGLGNLATTWRYSFEQSSVSSEALEVRSLEGTLEKRITVTKLALLAIIIILL
jgi:hypothetical protein